MSKTALITGGLRGIGRQIATDLASVGFTIHIFDLPDSQDQAVQNLPANWGYHSVDISDNSSVQSAFESIEQLDVLVNNAGITGDGLAVRIKADQWDRVLSVNLSGTFFVTQAALQRMIKKKKGYIISLSSIIAQRGNPGQAAYSASKGGIEAMTRTLAREYGRRGICVNAIAPGFIETDMTARLAPEHIARAHEQTAVGRLGTPADISQLVRFLVSGHADYITGTVIPVDGGITA